MPERSTRHRLIPAWVSVADATALGLFALAAGVFLAGGWRTTVAGIHISVRSGWRPVIWAALLVALRHLLFPKPNLAGRVLSTSRRLACASVRVADIAGRSAPRLASAGRDVLLAPLREARSLGAALGQCLSLARQSRAAIAVAVVLVVGRSLVFAWWDQAAFNSDHAIVGLMAKHLAEGRAFPLFFYGQSYMLGVQAWLAAPIFLVAGPSVLGLHLPLIAINALVASLLIVLLRRDLHLGSADALAASLVFVLAPPATAFRLVEANGGSVEPFLYVLLLWMFRGSPAFFGATLAFGFLHREFTAYALLALAGLRLLRGGPLQRAEVRRVVIAALWAGAVWGGVQALKTWSSPLGPGTSMTAEGIARTNVGEVLRRVCWSPADFPRRLLDVWNNHLDVLFGTGPHSLRAIGIRSRTAGQGLPGATLLLGTLFGAGLLRTVVLWRRRCAQGGHPGFAAYLGLVGAVSIASYGGLTCERIDPATLRYDLLGLLAVVASVAAFLGLERARAWRVAGFAAVIAWAAISVLAHGRLWDEYLLRPVPDDARLAVGRLQAEGVRHARGSYWVAYRLTFLSNERVVFASDGPVRIREYQDDPAAIAVSVRESPCEGGSRLAGSFYRCPAN